MGAERRVVFDLINVVQGDAKLSQALIRDKRLDNLHPTAGISDPATRDALTAEGVTRVINELRERFDWVICDSPAGIERGAATGHAPCRCGGGGDEPGSVLGARFGPHHRPVGFQDRTRRTWRADGKSTCC